MNIEKLAPFFGRMTGKTKVLRAKANLVAKIRYYSEGHLIATYDGGPCDIHFPDGKFVHVTFWSDDIVETRFYAKDSCKIAAIYDCHYKEVSSGDPSDMTIHGFDGTTIHLKSMKTTVPAHSESLIENLNERAIVCFDRVYQTEFSETFIRCERKLIHNDAVVGILKTSNITGSSRFEFDGDFSLTEQVFLALLLR